MLPRACGAAPLALIAAAVACGPGHPASPTPAAQPAATALPVGDTGRANTEAISGRLPPVPLRRGPLTLHIVYPPAGAPVQARDSSFLFGTAGTGEAKVWVNGQPARVWPNGAWLAWIRLPPDSALRFTVTARIPSDSTMVLYTAHRADPPRRPCTPAVPCAGAGAVWLDSTSLRPQGSVWWPAGEYLPLSIRASEGAEVRLRLRDGSVVPMKIQSRLREVPAAVRAFDRDTANLRAEIQRDRYIGLLRGRQLGPEPGSLVPLPDPLTLLLPTGLGRCLAGLPCVPGARWVPADSGWATVEAIRGRDTVRVRWPLQLELLDSLPTLVEFHDDTAAGGVPDSMTVGRALPGGTYHWFFPSGTVAQATGRVNGDLRVRLSAEAEAWVPAAEARPAATGVVGSRAVVGSVTLTPLADRVVLRIPVTQRVPFQLTEAERSLTLRLYGAAGDVDWMRYGSADSLIRRMSWAQAAADEVTLTLELGRPLWGYRARWVQSDLLLEVRRPPRIEESDPLRGLRIAVDPGHPPVGATGPTGLREADANLAVGLELQRLLAQAGARVIMTRTSDTPIDLWPRLQIAEAADADVLVSIHNNALPDGINPFTNNGTSVFYNHVPSLPLARAIQAELLRRLGLRDLGIGRGDLALVRGTWMPSVLTEGLFMILPDQEAALRSREGQHLYALGVLEGLRRFLRERAQSDGA